MKMKLFYLLALLMVLLIISCRQAPETAGGETSQPEETIDEALQKLSDRIRANPNSDELYIERANYYLANDELENALRDIMFAIDINDRSPNHYITLSETYLALGNPDSSFEGLEKALAIDPENQEAMLKKAQLYLIMQQYDKTYETIIDLIALDRFNPTAYYIRGYAQLEQGDTVLAIRNFKIAIDQRQDYYEAFMQLGVIYSVQQNPIAADYLSNAIEVRPNSPEPYYQLGLFFQENGQLQQAINSYRIILDIEPDYVFAIYNIGYIHLVYLRDFETAANYFSQVIEISPNNYDAWYNRGYSHELAGNKTLARNDYLKALDVRTNYQKAIDGLNRLN